MCKHWFRSSAAVAVVATGLLLLLPQQSSAQIRFTIGLGGSGRGGLYIGNAPAYGGWGYGGLGSGSRYGWGYPGGGYSWGYSPRVDNFGYYSPGYSSSYYSPGYSGSYYSPGYSAAGYGIYSPSYGTYSPSSYAVPDSYSYQSAPSTYRSFDPLANYNYNSSLAVIDNQANQAGSIARVMVHVPDPNAELWFNGTWMPKRGAQRVFNTPALTSGRDYFYTVRARWMENDREVVRTRSVAVRAGQQATVDFVWDDASDAATPAATDNNLPRPVDVSPNAQDRRPVEIERRPVDVNPNDRRPVYGDPNDRRPVDINPSDRRPVDGYPSDRRPVDVNPSDQRPVDLNPDINRNPNDRRPLDNNNTNRDTEMQPVKD